MPFRAVLVGHVDGGAQIVEVQTVRSERPRIYDHAHGGPVSARDAHDADALYLRDLLRDTGIRQVLHRGQRHDVRRDAEGKNRRVRGIHLRVDRGRGQVLRHEVLRAADGRLHFLLGDVDRERQIELQRDDRRAGGARRRHLVQARHLAELLLQRCRDRGGDDLRTRAGIEGLHLDGRVCDLGQRRQGQLQEGDETDHEDGDHQQRRRHGAQNEDA